MKKRYGLIFPYMCKLPARSNKTELQGFEVFLLYPLVFGLWSSVSPLLPSLPGHCHRSSSWCRGACCELLGFAEFACDVLTMGQFQILTDFFMSSERSLVSGQKMEQKVFHKQFLKERPYRKPPNLEHTLVIKNYFCNTTCCSKLFLPPSLDLHSP